MTVVVRQGSDVNWIPVTIDYHYKSKYPLEGMSARRRDHDFKLELEAVLETRLPYELVCAVHQIERKEVIIENITERVKTYYATLQYGNIEYVARFTEFDLKNRPKRLIYRIADEFKQVVGRRLSKRTIVEWLKVDFGYYFPQYFPEYVKYAHIVGHPLLIRNIEVVQQPIMVEAESVAPFYTTEDPETVRNGVAEAVAIVMERLTDEFLEDVYNFPTAVEFKTESGVEDLEPDCNPSTTDIITAPIDDTSIIEEYTAIKDARMLRANNLDETPKLYDYWSERYKEFLQSLIRDIIYDLVQWYENWLKEHLRGGE